MVWRPFMRQMGEIGETRSILATSIRQWRQEPLNGFAPNSHGRRVWSFPRTSWNVKVKSQGSRSPGTKTRCALTTPPPYGRNGTASLQITSRKQQARRFDRCGGVSSPGCVRWAWRATAGLCHVFLVHHVTVNFDTDLDLRT